MYYYATRNVVLWCDHELFHHIVENNALYALCGISRYGMIPRTNCEEELLCPICSYLDVNEQYAKRRAIREDRDDSLPNW